MKSNEKPNLWFYGTAKRDVQGILIQWRLFQDKTMFWKFVRINISQFDYTLSLIWSDLDGKPCDKEWWEIISIKFKLPMIKTMHKCTHFQLNRKCYKFARAAGTLEARILITAVELHYSSRLARTISDTWRQPLLRNGLHRSGYFLRPRNCSRISHFIGILEL